jgi:hypothetical protein
MSSAAFDALEVGRLTWIGLAVAGIGWAVLLGETAIVDVLTLKVPRPLPPTFHVDLIDIAKCIIGSGFGVATIGALQSGFGTLNRFFSAVLVRSEQRTAAQTGPVVDSAAASGRGHRPYRTLPDGSIEVETILGTRRFATMREARDFI